jgi:hypothetical protein
VLAAGTRCAHEALVDSEVVEGKHCALPRVPDRCPTSVNQRYDSPR